MPDQITRGPWIDFCRQLGIQGLQERYTVTGEQLACVCLIHGTTPAHIQFTTVVPYIGGRMAGRPMVMPLIAVWCWPSCGYRLAWVT